MELTSGKATLLTVIAFIVGGVAIPIFSELRNSFNQTKELSHKEMNVNSQYLNVINDLSEFGIQKQLELAKYFSCVSTDEETRRGWLRYYKIKEKEYEKYIKSKDSINFKINEILFGDKLILENGKSKIIRGKNYKKDITDRDMYILSGLKLDLKEIEKRFFNKSINVDTNTKTNINKTVFIHYPEGSQNKINYLKLMDADWSIYKEKRKEMIKNNQIRYWYDEDLGLANNLKSLLESSSESYEIKKFYGENQQGQLEIWLKSTN